MRLPKTWLGGLVITTAALLNGCGEPPAMVNMAPPGLDSDIVTDAVNNEEFRASALGEEAISRSRVEGNREIADEPAETDEAPDIGPEPESEPPPSGIPPVTNDDPGAGEAASAEPDGQDESS